MTSPRNFFIITKLLEWLCWFEVAVYRGFGILIYRRTLNTTYTEALHSTANSVQIGEQLRSCANTLHGKYTSVNEAGVVVVDYDAIYESYEFQQYCQVADSLIYVNMGEMSVAHRRAFLLNVYNALIWHATMVLRPHTFPQKMRMYQSASYTIGPHVYSLEEIEHGLLRGNRKPPGARYRAIHKPTDPRLAYSFDHVDPRIHFALNCGAMGCPAVRFYSGGEKLEKDLTKATNAFCASIAITLTDSKHTSHVLLSQIFKWYGYDFLTDQRIQRLNTLPYDEQVLLELSLLQALLPYVSAEQRTKIAEFIRVWPTLPNSGDDDDVHPIKYAPYDWSTNHS